MTHGTTVHTTDYLDGFQYYNSNLEFFAHAQGYVKQTTLQGQMTFDYIYNYTDHLGNVRVSYTKDPQTGDLKILEENHYYPFGLKHQKYADMSGKIGAINDETAKAVIPDDPSQSTTPYRNYDYKYNGKEWQDELGLNMYDMDMRMYDPAIARWVVMDPVVHHSMSPYNAFDNNPVYWADPSGAEAESNNSDSGGGESTGISMMGIPLEGMGVARIDVYGLGDGSQFSNSNTTNKGNSNNSKANSNGTSDVKFEGDDPTITLPEVVVNDMSQLEGALEQRANEALAIWSNWGRSNNGFGFLGLNGSWGIGPLDWLTQKISSLYNNYELYVDGDNHILWGPQIALEGKIEGVGLGFAYGEDMIEDNIGSPGVPGTMYRDELSVTTGMFGVEFNNRKDAVAGSVVSASNSVNVGPVSITNTNGKTSYSVGPSLRLGLGLIGFKLSGEIGIREK